MPRRSKISKDSTMNRQVCNVDDDNDSDGSHANLSSDTKCSPTSIKNEIGDKRSTREIELEEALKIATDRLRACGLDKDQVNQETIRNCVKSPTVLSQSGPNSHRQPAITNPGNLSDLPKVELTYFDGNPAEFCQFTKQFEYYVEAKSEDYGQRLLYLLHYCRGCAREAIEDCIMLPPSIAYVKAKEILKELFGQPYRVARLKIDGLLNEACDVPHTADGLSRLAVKMRGCSIALEQLEYQADLNSLNTLEHIVRRLPINLQFKWAKRADEINCSNREPTFVELTEFISESARIARGRFGQLAENSLGSSKVPSPKKQYSRDVSRANSKVNSFVTFKSESKCPLCKFQHDLVVCSQFVQLDVPSRWTEARRMGVCFICLKESHRAMDCWNKVACGVDGCRGHHHSLLHNSDRRPRFNTPLKNGGTCASTNSGRNRVRLGVLPVCVQTPTGIVTTYAFLDNGSDTTLVRRRFVEKYKLPTSPSNLVITTLNGQMNTKSAKTKLKLHPVTMDESVDVDEAYTIENLPIGPVEPLAKSFERWTHLRNIDFKDIESKEVDILIGCNVPDAHWVLDQKVGGWQVGLMQ